MTKAKALTEKELITTMKKVLKTFIADSNCFYYRTLLTAEGIYPSKLSYWLKKDIKSINDIYAELESIQEHRIVEGMLRKSSDINPTAAMFYLKSKKGYIEEEKRRHLDLEAKKCANPLTNISDLKIEVAYNTKQSRSDNDITKLIRESTEKEDATNED